MTNIAIIGGGQGGTKILGAFHGMEAFKIIGVFDVNHAAPGIKLARKLDVAVFQDLKDLIGQPDLDIIIEATGNEQVRDQLLLLKPPRTSLMDFHLANFMMVLLEAQESALKRARGQKEAFQRSAEFLTQTYGKEGVIYFTTDRERYDFVKNLNTAVSGIEVGRSIVDGGMIESCIRTRQMVAGNVPKETYGIRLNAWVIPVFEDDDDNKPVIGTLGVSVPKVHPVAKAFDVFAPIIISCQPQGAWVGVSDLETLICAQGSEKFDIPEFGVGKSMKEDYSTREIIKNHKATQFDLERAYAHIRIRGIPLFDEDSGELNGTFAVVVPRTMAHDMQEMAGKLSANTQEIAGVMQEIAASAGEICLNEAALAEHIKAVQNNAVNISEIIGFTKNVADSTKMLGLNAAIEAARAGEHGRGFGVVAEEIRRLSDQSKQTADQIGQLIKRIDSTVQEAVQASETTVRSSQEQAAATEEISASVMEMAEVAEKLLKIAQTL